MARRRLLMLTHSAGFKHDYLPAATDAVKELGEETGQFDVIAVEDCGAFDWSRLHDFSAVLFATTGELPMSEEQKRSLIEFVKSGKGFVGVHNAADTFYKFPEYGEIVGGYFNGHPWTQEVRVVVEDQSHPATSFLPPKFVVKEEVYTFKDWSRDKVHVLISLDNSSVDLGKGTRSDHDYAVCWHHGFGQGRAFYTAFGHFKEIWGERWFRMHLAQGILWAMGSGGG